MDVKELRVKYLTVTKKEPLDELELLQFAKVSYIKGELTITEYRDIVKEMESSLTTSRTIRNT